MTTHESLTDIPIPPYDGQLVPQATRDFLDLPDLASLMDRSNLEKIKPGNETSEFGLTRIAQFGGASLFAFVMTAQYFIDQAAALPTAITVTALIVAGVLAAWPTVLYATNRRRLKSERVTAQQRLFGEAIQAASAPKLSGALFERNENQRVYENLTPIIQAEVKRAVGKVVIEKPPRESAFGSDTGGDGALPDASTEAATAAGG